MAALPVAPPLVARSAAYINSLFLRCPILEFLWVYESDRGSGTVEDDHHLARHVECDDWALCAAAAQEIAEVTDLIVEPGGFKGLVKLYGASIDVPDSRMDRVPPLARDCDIS